MPVGSPRSGTRVSAGRRTRDPCARARRRARGRSRGLSPRAPGHEPGCLRRRALARARGARRARRRPGRGGWRARARRDVRGARRSGGRGPAGGDVCGPAPAARAGARGDRRGRGARRARRAAAAVVRAARARVRRARRRTRLARAPARDDRAGGNARGRSVGPARARARAGARRRVRRARRGTPRVRGAPRGGRASRAGARCRARTGAQAVRPRARRVPGRGAPARGVLDPRLGGRDAGTRRRARRGRGGRRRGDAGRGGMALRARGGARRRGARTPDLRRRRHHARGAALRAHAAHPAVGVARARGGAGARGGGREREPRVRSLFGPEEEAFRAEVRAFLAGWADLDAYLCHGPKWPRVAALFRALGARGWLSLAWPKEHGGGGLPPSFEYILWDEAAQARAARNPLLTIVARTLLRAGSEAQRARWLPPIRAGELHFALGYSEPEAGSDLASLRTRAVRRGDIYVIDGEKCWQSYAGHVDALWLLVRTG